MSNVELPARKIATPSGLALSVREAGAGDLTCVLIHGLGDGSFVWEDFCPAIVNSFRLCNLELRGHGDSSWDSAKHYSLDDYVADTESVLDALGLKACILIGHSLGGSVATRLIENRKELVVAAVLIETGPMPDAEVAKYVRDQLIESYQTFASPAEYSAWLSQRRPLLSADAAARIAHSSLSPLSTGGFRPKFDIDVARCEAPDETEDWWRSKLSLPCFDLPILLVRGAGSAVLYRDAVERMARVLPQSTVGTVPLAGHAVMTDNPSGFADVVDPFLKTLL